LVTVPAGFGPVTLDADADADAIALRSEVHATLEKVGTIRVDVTAKIYFDGLASKPTPISRR